MKFFNLDLHVSVIADIKDIFTNLGHEVTDWSISGSCWVTGVEQKQVDVINQYTWKFLSPELIEQFINRYKGFLSEFDGFICSYPPSFALLYKYFNKPIITIIPIRYEHPFTADKNKWEWLNKELIDGIENGLIIPVANNKYDQEYFRSYTGYNPLYIPSLCEYTKSSWTGTKDKFLVCSRGIVVNHDKLIMRDQLGKISWEEMYSYSGIVHFPYTCSTMSYFEQYTAGVPLYFPSKTFLKQLYFQFFNQNERGLLFDWTFNRYYGISKGALSPSFSSVDYNDLNSEEALDKFLDLCDFYDEEMMPDINFFDSCEELIAKLEFGEPSRKDNRKERKELIYNSWKKILNMLR